MLRFILFVGFSLLQFALFCQDDNPNRSRVNNTMFEFTLPPGASDGPMEIVVTFEYYFSRTFFSDQESSLCLNMKVTEYNYNDGLGAYRFKYQNKVYRHDEMEYVDSRSMEGFTDVQINDIKFKIGVSGLGIVTNVDFNSNFETTCHLGQIPKDADLNNFHLDWPTAETQEIYYTNHWGLVTRINEFNKHQQNSSKYEETIRKADQAFDSKNWTEAKNLYATAQKIFPDENYPSDKINEIDEIIVDEKAAKLEKEQALADEKRAEEERIANEAEGKTADGDENADENTSESGEEEPWVDEQSGEPSSEAASEYWSEGSSESSSGETSRGETSSGETSSGESASSAASSSSYSSSTTSPEQMAWYIKNYVDPAVRSEQLAQYSYYTQATLNDASDNLESNSRLSGNYSTIEELEAEFYQKQRDLDQSIEDLTAAQNANLSANYEVYSPYRDERTEAIGQTVVGIITIINDAQVEREKREAQAALQRQKEEAQAEILRREEEIRISKRESFLSQFPAGGIPLSSHKVTTNILYFFAYTFDSEDISSIYPSISVTNVFPIAQYSDGTWPFLATILAELEKAGDGNPLTLVGYYSTEEMAIQMSESFVRLAGISDLSVSNFEYNGKPLKSGASNNGADFWGTPTPSTVTKPQTEEKVVQPKANTEDFWGEPLKTQGKSTTEKVPPTNVPENNQNDFWGTPVKPTKEVPVKSTNKTPIENPEVDFWGNPIKKN